MLRQRPADPSHPRTHISQFTYPPLSRMITGGLGLWPIGLYSYRRTERPVGSPTTDVNQLPTKRTDGPAVCSHSGPPRSRSWSRKDYWQKQRQRDKPPSFFRPVLSSRIIRPVRLTRSPPWRRPPLARNGRLRLARAPPRQHPAEPRIPPFSLFTVAIVHRPPTFGKVERRDSGPGHLLRADIDRIPGPIKE
jgi:hypothetical protein